MPVEPARPARPARPAISASQKGLPETNDRKGWHCLHLPQLEGSDGEEKEGTENYEGDDDDEEDTNSDEKEDADEDLIKTGPNDPLKSFLKN